MVVLKGSFKLSSALHVGGVDAAVIISISRATVALVTWLTASWR